jgi:hypothetical protein
MNRREQRALREIEENLAREDPRFHELFRTYGKRRWVSLHRYAAWTPSRSHSWVLRWGTSCYW